MHARTNNSMADRFIVRLKITPPGSGTATAFRNRDALSTQGDGGAWSFADGDRVELQPNPAPGFQFATITATSGIFQYPNHVWARVSAPGEATVTFSFSPLPAPPPPPPPPPPEPIVSLPTPISTPSGTPIPVLPSLPSSPDTRGYFETISNLLKGITILAPSTFSGAADVVSAVKSSSPVSGKKITFVGKFGPKIGGAVLNGLAQINYNAAFGDFILEEAMQGAAFPISILLREKEYALAQKQLDILKEIWTIAKEYRDTVGAYNWITGEAFEANLQSIATQILAYQEIIKKYNIPLPKITADFTALARTIQDGDTVKCKIGAETVVVRLVGINTPESGEPYYSDSKKALFRKIWGSEIDVKVEDSRIFDDFGRVLGVIYDEGRNINLEMVREGWAFFYPFEAHSAVNAKLFQEAENFARAEKRGIWGLIRKADLTAPQGLIAGPKIRTGLKISSTPSHAEITLDGEYTYKQTPETLDVEQGKHTVQIDSYGFDSQVQEIEVPDGVIVEIHVKLNKL